MCNSVSPSALLISRVPNSCGRLGKVGGRMVKEFGYYHVTGEHTVADNQSHQI